MNTVHLSADCNTTQNSRFVLCYSVLQRIELEVLAPADRGDTISELATKLDHSESYLSRAVSDLVEKWTRLHGTRRAAKTSRPVGCSRRRTQTFNPHSVQAACLRSAGLELSCVTPQDNAAESTGHYGKTDRDFNCDLLLTVNGEASHVRTATLGWDICWLTTRRYDGPMAGPHRRYSYPGMGLGVILVPRHHSGSRGCLERSGPQSPDIVHLGGGETASVCVILRPDHT